jgi:hypothetical protein
VKLKYHGQPDSKSARKEEYLEDPSYCCTLLLKIEKEKIPE